MKKYILHISLSTLLLTSIVFANFIKSGSLQGKSDGSNIIITWQSESEDNLKFYLIERKSASTFSEIAKINPKGNNYFYQFIDETAFKTNSSIYVYRIKIVDQNNNFFYSPEITVTHHVSSVKKTWGSLKAMFR